MKSVENCNETKRSTDACYCEALNGDWIITDTTSQHIKLVAIQYEKHSFCAHTRNSKLIPRFNYTIIYLLLLQYLLYIFMISFICFKTCIFLFSPNISILCNSIFSLILLLRITLFCKHVLIFLKFLNVHGFYYKFFFVVCSLC